LTGLQERRVLKSPLDKIYELQQKTDDMGLRVSRSPLLIYKKFKERTFHLSRSLFILNPEVRIRRIKEILSELTKGLETTIGHRMEMFDKRLQGELGRLNALSPLSVMERGYSICRRMPDMKIIKNSTEVEKGGQVNVRLSRGELICRVEEQKP